MRSPPHLPENYWLAITLLVSLSSAVARAQNLTVPAARTPTTSTLEDRKYRSDIARSALEAGDYQKALSTLLDIYVLNSTPGVLVNFGEVYERQGDFRSAISCYKQYMATVDNSLHAERSPATRQRIEKSTAAIDDLKRRYSFLMNDYPKSHCIQRFVLPEAPDAPPGDRVSIRMVGPTDRSIQPVLYFRRKGDAKYSRTNFVARPDPASEWFAEVGVFPTDTSIQYYVEFFDHDGRILAPAFEKIADSQIIAEGNTQSDGELKDEDRNVAHGSAARNGESPSNSESAGQSTVFAAPFHREDEPGQILIVDPSRAKGRPPGVSSEDEPVPWVLKRSTGQPLPVQSPTPTTAAPQPKRPPSAPWPMSKRLEVGFLAVSAVPLAIGAGLLAKAYANYYIVEQNASCEGGTNQVWTDGIAVCPHFGRNRISEYNRSLQTPSADIYSRISSYRAGGISMLASGMATLGTGITFLMINRFREPSHDHSQSNGKRAALSQKRDWNLGPVIAPHGVGLTSRIEF